MGGLGEGPRGRSRSHEQGFSFHNKQMRYEATRGHRGSLTARPACGNQAGGEGREKEGRAGSPGFPELRNAGISAAAPPRSARTQLPPPRRGGPATPITRGGLQAPSTDSAQLRPASRTSPAETPPLLPPAGGLSGRKLVTRFPHRGRRPRTPNPAEGEILSAPLAPTQHDPSLDPSLSPPQGSAWAAAPTRTDPGRAAAQQSPAPPCAAPRRR